MMCWLRKAALSKSTCWGEKILSATRDSSRPLPIDFRISYVKVLEASGKKLSLQVIQIRWLRRRITLIVSGKEDIRN